MKINKSVSPEHYSFLSDLKYCEIETPTFFNEDIRNKIVFKLTTNLFMVMEVGTKNTAIVTILPWPIALTESHKSDITKFDRSFGLETTYLHSTAGNLSNSNNEKGLSRKTSPIRRRRNKKWSSAVTTISDYFSKAKLTKPFKTADQLSHKKENTGFDLSRWIAKTKMREK